EAAVQEERRTESCPERDDELDSLASNDAEPLNIGVVAGANRLAQSLRHRPIEIEADPALAEVPGRLGNAFAHHAREAHRYTVEIALLLRKLDDLADDGSRGGGARRVDA